MTESTIQDPEPEWEGIPLAASVPFAPPIPTIAQVAAQAVAPVVKSDPVERAADALEALVHGLQSLNIKAERILQALEQRGSTAGMPQTFPPVYTPAVVQPGGTGQWSLPQQQPGGDPRSQWICPIHGTGARYVPAGNRKSDGKPYAAFWACTTQGCRQKVA